MSIDGISTPAAYVWDSQSEQKLTLPPEIRDIIYGFLDSRRLSQLYSIISHSESGVIGDHLTLLYRIEVVKAASIKDPDRQAERLKEIGQGQLQVNTADALETVSRISVLHLKIQLLCEIGTALANQGNDDAAKMLFAQARSETDAFKATSQKVYSLVRIGKAELTSNDQHGAEVTFAKAEGAAESEKNPHIKAQFKRLIQNGRG